VLETIEERYGEEAGADYLINAAHYLTQSCALTTGSSIGAGMS